MIDFTIGHVVILKSRDQSYDHHVVYKCIQHSTEEDVWDNVEIALHERENFLRILKLLLNFLQWVFRNDLTVVIFILSFFN